MDIIATGGTLILLGIGIALIPFLVMLYSAEPSA